MNYRLFTLGFAGLLVALPSLDHAQLAPPANPAAKPAPPQIDPLALKMQTLFQRALKNQQGNKPKLAIPDYVAFLKLAKENKLPASTTVPALGNLAYCYALTGNVKEQESTLVELTKQMPDNGVAFAQLASVTGGQKKWAKSKEYALKALASKKLPATMTLASYFSLGVAALETNDTKTAIPALKKASELAPKNGQVRFNYAIALAKATRFDEALKEAIAARDISPDLIQPVSLWRRSFSRRRISRKPYKITMEF